MILVKDLSHSFGTFKVLENVNFEVKDGSIMGLVGINGAGKSTLLRLMSGIYEPESGSVEYDGGDPRDSKVRENIFFLPDDPYYSNQSTAAKLLKMYKMMYPSLDESIYKEIMTMFQLDENKALRSFSKGMRRQTFIALAFAVAPKYLLLDEAFDGLDPMARKMFKDRIRELTKSKGITVIISSHALKELEDFCDDYLMIDSKHLVSSGEHLQRATGYVKFQLAFEDKITEDMIRERRLPVKSLKITGRVVNIVLEGDKDNLIDKLKELKPLIIDELEMNFEESFIEDIDRKIRGGEQE